MGKIALWAVIAAVSAAPVVAKADGWRVPLPERRAALKISKLGSSARSNPADGPVKVALPPPAPSTRRPQVDDDTAERAAPTVYRAAAATDPDVPVARDQVRPRRPLYGPERLRADYYGPGRVSATAYRLPATQAHAGGAANSSRDGRSQPRLRWLLLR